MGTRQREHRGSGRRAILPGRCAPRLVLSGPWATACSGRRERKGPGWREYPASAPRDTDPSPETGSASLPSTSCNGSPPPTPPAVVGARLSPSREMTLTSFLHRSSVTLCCVTLEQMGGAMLFRKIAPESTVPIYEQIVAQVIFAIASGSKAVGELIPSVRDLALQLTVHPNTVARAYQELERRGVI